MFENIVIVSYLNICAKKVNIHLILFRFKKKSCILLHNLLNNKKLWPRCLAYSSICDNAFSVKFRNIFIKPFRQQDWKIWLKLQTCPFEKKITEFWGILINGFIIGNFLQSICVLNTWCMDSFDNWITWFKKTISS